MWLAEAGQPVCVPGVSHQQLHRPSCDHSSESFTDHEQDLTEARPAEDLGEDTLEERHPGAEREIGGYQQAARPSSCSDSGCVHNEKLFMLKCAETKLFHPIISTGAVTTAVTIMRDTTSSVR